MKNNNNNKKENEQGKLSKKNKKSFPFLTSFAHIPNLLILLDRKLERETKNPHKK